MIVGVLCGGTAHAQMVQSTSCNTDNGTTLTCYFPSVFTAGDLLLVTSANTGTGVAVSSITLNGTWQRLGATTFSSGNKHIELWAAPNIAGGDNRVTVNYTGSTDAAVRAVEFAGVMTANFSDVACSDVNQGQNGQTLTASASCTPAEGNTIVVMAGAATGAQGQWTFTAGSGFTMAVQRPSALANYVVGLEYATQTAATPVTGTMTISPAGDWGTVRAALICNGACAVPATISTFAPLGGEVGSTVTITGTNFGTTQGTSTVTFAGVAATPATWSDTSITVPVPPGAATGPLVVTVKGVPSNGPMFTLPSSRAPIVQTTTCAVAQGTDITCVLLQPTVAGDVLLVASQSEQSISSITGMTNGQIGSVQYNYGVKDLEVWAARDSTGGTTSVTVTYRATTNAAVVVTALTGLGANWLGTPCGSNFGPDGIGLPRLDARAPCTPTADNALVFAAGASTGAFADAPTYSAGAGLTMLGQSDTPPGSDGVALEYQVQTTATAVSPTMVVAPPEQWGMFVPVLQCNGPCPTPPFITALSSPSGAALQAITITGVNFGATQGTSSVTFNGMVADVTGWSDTSITTSVPVGATTGPIVVTVSRMPSNGVPFTIQSNPALTGCYPGPGTIVYQQDWSKGVAPAAMPNSPVYYPGTLFYANTQWGGNGPVDPLYPEIAIAESVTVVPGAGPNGENVVDFNPAGSQYGEDYQTAAVVFGDFGALQDPTNGNARWWDASQGCVSVKYQWTTATWNQSSYDPLIALATRYSSWVELDASLDYNASTRTNDSGAFVLTYPEFDRARGDVTWVTVDLSPFTRADTENRWQSLDMRWKAGSTDAYLSDVAPDGWLQVFWNGQLIFDQQNIPLVINPGGSTVDGWKPNLIRALWQGYYGLFGPTTDLLVTTSTLRNADVSNTPPTVTITSPLDRSTFPYPATIDVTADASDPDGTVARVDFFANGQPIGSAAPSPYAISWTPSRAGRYILVAKATDDVGASSYSAAVVIQVGALGQPSMPTGPDVPQYFDVDAVGSVRAVTDATGGTIARYDYLPFGELWNTGSIANPRQYAGKEQDSETGFNYFGGRYQYSLLGRFTSADPPQFGDPASPQSWNRYSYTLNSPLYYADPEGHETCVNGFDPDTQRYCAEVSATQRPDLSFLADWSHRFAIQAALADQPTQPTKAGSTTTTVTSLEGLRTYVFHRPWVFSWIVPIAPFFGAAGVGPAGDVELNPDTHTLCAGLGIGASVGKNWSVGPLTHGVMVGSRLYPNRADELLSGGSIAGGWTLPVFVGVQAIQNNAGAALGPAVGVPGISLASTNSTCIKLW